MKKNLAIDVTDLSKTYKLYNKDSDVVKEIFTFKKKTYHQLFYALQKVSFQIKQGESVGIIGKNGSGKSTLLKILTGVLTQTSGRKSTKGRVSAILELGSGFNPEMTGLENIHLNMSLNGMKKNEIADKIKEILDFAELEEFINHPIKTYSSGMKARLSFAVAINIEPEILIVDEALSVGDAAFQRKCFAKIEEIQKSGATILFVSHSASQIVNLCDRAIWLSHGKLVLDGASKVVTDLYMKNINNTTLDFNFLHKEYTTILTKQKVKATSKKNTTLSDEEHYNTSLVPKSTVNYANEGASIKDLSITTMEGKKVNVLVHGREYYYNYYVSYEDMSEDIKVGFLIKNVRGSELGGGSVKLQNYIKSGNSFLVQWKFICLFAEGNYYLNAGTSSPTKHMHRIVDGYAFKVLPIKNKIFTATMNIVKDCNIKEVNQ